MGIFFNKRTQTFHLFNDNISYIMTVLPGGQMSQLYFGKKIHHREDFSYLLETAPRPMASYLFENDRTFSLEHIRQEYGVYGSTDYRSPAVDILQENGARICDFQYVDHMITPGKPKLAGLPATYTEEDSEADTLILILRDPVTGIRLQLLYTIFSGENAIARSAAFYNDGDKTVHLQKAMSLCMDLPDYNYDLMHFSGAWSRERHTKIRSLEMGIQSVGSMRGHSSHEHNPFVILKRKTADEFQGEAIG
ncbi:MAG: glycoside hydrolase family 36 N-terminal domain-containing protein, partial [Lachnospiraceae bacterium]